MIADTRRRSRLKLTLAVAGLVGALGADDPSRPSRADGGARGSDSGSTDLAARFTTKAGLFTGPEPQRATGICSQCDPMDPIGET